jgi:hypothetical protein
VVPVPAEEEAVPAAAAEAAAGEAAAVEAEAVEAGVVAEAEVVAEGAEEAACPFVSRAT